MKTPHFTIGGTIVGLAFVAVCSGSARGQIQSSLPAYVKLQTATPGTAQTGHANLTGKMTAGSFSGDGASLTNLSATNITAGTLSYSRLPLDIAKLNANNVFLGQTNTFYSFVGVTRNTQVTSAEQFGLGNDQLTGYNGMYVETSANGKPFYGYSLNGQSSAYHFLDGSNGYWKLYNGGATRLTVTDDGKVGVGTVEPFYDFELANKNLYLTNGSGGRYAGLFYFNGAGVLQTYCPTNRTTVSGYYDSNTPNTGLLATCDSVGVQQSGMYTTLAGQGTIFADVKNFRVPNPRNPQEDIVYACVEGPEAAAYIRGTGHLVNGRAHVSLPQHFQDVCVLDGMTIQLTPGSLDSKGLAFGKRTLAGFEVGELSGGKGDYEFNWEVKCVRKGHEDYRPLRPWTETAKNATDLREAWAARMTSIAIKESSVRFTAP